MDLSSPQGAVIDAVFPANTAMHDGSVSTVRRDQREAGQDRLRLGWREYYLFYFIFLGSDRGTGRPIAQLEWTNIDAFSFRDGFFSKQKTDDLRSWASVEQALFTLQSPSRA